MMKRLCFLLLLLSLSSCHPFFMFKPTALKSMLAASSKPGSDQKITVAVDSYGIPFIKAPNKEASVYGLGFLHARDRLFQLDFIRHAALGRAAELFGEKALGYDHKLRILSYRLAEQLEKLSTKERQLIQAYVAGVNDGARLRGRSAEHFLLGADFEALSELHVIAIARLQAWTLGSDIVAELSRLRLAQSPDFEAIKQDYLSMMDDRHTGIVGTTLQKTDLTRFLIPRYPKKSPIDLNQPRATIKDFAQFEDGASNAWVIEGGLMNNNHALLMNDPHLHHSWPSNFYLATLMQGDSLVSGASFVGLPAILIGATPHVSWGVTASYLNTQDTVLLKSASSQSLSYSVDDKEYVLQTWPQQFCVDKKGKCSDEEFYTSIFGPVMDHRHDAWIDSDNRLAVMWTGFLVEEHSSILLPFFDMLEAKTVFEAEKIIKTMTLPGVNMVLADTDGAIAYAYAGIVPERDVTQHPLLPLDGGTSASLWKNFLKKPVLKHPKDGFIVTANQNIFDKNAGPQFFFGQQGAAPFRAMRIKEQITAKKQQSRLDPTELLALQLDSVSLEAKELAPKLGALCKERVAKNASSSLKQFVDLIENFDGDFTVESRAALPYEILLAHLMLAELSPVVGPSLAGRALYVGHLNYAFKQSLINKLNNNDQSAREFVSSHCQAAYDGLVKQYGSSPSKWRYGKHHYLERQSPLAQAPIVGMLFKDQKREVAGTSSSPLAEVGMPVMYGANLRFQAVMSKPAQLKFVLDSGNSGVVGEKNSLDQAELWHKGQMIDMELDWQQAWHNARSRFELDYQSSSISTSSSSSKS